MVLFLLLSGKRPLRSKVLNLIRSTFLDRILTTPLPPPSLPFPPLLLHTLTSCDFGEKWRGRGGGFIFIIRKDGYRSIKLFPWKKKENADDSERKLSWDYSIPRKFTHRQRVKTDKFFNVQSNCFETSLTFLFQDFPLVSDSVQFFCSLPSTLYCFTTRFSVISISLVTQSSQFPISFISYFPLISPFSLISTLFSYFLSLIQYSTFTPYHYTICSIKFQWIIQFCIFFP